MNPDRSLRGCCNALWRRLPIPIWVRRRVEGMLLYPKLPELRGRNFAPGPFLVAGYLQSGLGLGEAARLDVLALRSAGFRTELLDLSDTMLIRDLEDPDFANSPALSASGPLILHVNAPLAAISLRRVGGEALSGRPIIGYWAWELPKPLPHWRKAYAYLEELWVPSSFAAQAFADCPVPLRVVPHPVMSPPSAGMAARAFGIPDGVCVFLAVGDLRSSEERKNLVGAVTAFKDAFGASEHVLLLIKLHHTAESPNGMQRLSAAIGGQRNIKVLDMLMPRPVVGDLFRAADVFVSLHRAEGFGLPMAEAMLLGKPVIATGWSGNMDFMNRDVAAVVDYDLVPVALQGCNLNYAGLEKMRWAEPRLLQAAEYMRTLADDPALRGRLGARGKVHAEEYFAVDRFLARLEGSLALQYGRP